MKKYPLIFGTLTLMVGASVGCTMPATPALPLLSPTPTAGPGLIVAPPPLPTKAPPTPIVNQTSHGYIRADEIWQGEMHITGDIIVDQGVTLTIQPGTTVYVAANRDEENLLEDPFDLKIGIKQEDNVAGGVHLGEPYRDEAHHISIVILGKLIAVGTPEQRITLTSDSVTPSIYDWNRLDVAEGSISYALIEYYRVLDLGGKAEIRHNELRHIGECGVCANSSGLVEDNHIWDAGHELIDMHGSSPTIKNNRLGPYPKRSAIIIDGGSPLITGNTFENCGGGILMISPSTPIIENNQFTNTPRHIQTTSP
jgi:parallel beta-helix repeat protein